MKKILRRISQQSWLLGGMFAVLLLFFAGTVWFMAQNRSTSEDRVAQIVADPRTFYGKGVSLSGNVDELIGSRAFTIESPGIVGGSLLVLSKKPLQPVGGSGIDEFFFQENERVMVDGEVRVFNLREVERELGVDLVDAAFLTWEGRPVVIADDVVENK